MATKKEQAVQRAVNREHQKGKVREEKHFLWILLLIIGVLLWLLLAQHFGWWPHSRPKLGSAFYTNIAANTDTPSNASDTDDGSGGSDDGSGNNNGGSGGGGNTTTPPSSGSDSILDFAVGVNVGTSKTELSGEATGLNENCAVIVGAEAQTAGKQEVCTYSQGDKIVTVTYLNDRVISASKSGF